MSSSSSDTKIFNDWIARASLEKQPHQEEAVRWCLNKELKGDTSFGKKPIRGGLIADEMGLGKTIQILGVLISNYVEHTLIVLPRALLEQWDSTIKKNFGVAPLIYHSSGNRKATLSELKSARFVLTTYSMISRYTPLRAISWDRAVFDEAHHMRNRGTRLAEGVSKLKAKIRWLVTGTPIQNGITDFANLMNVLGVKEDITGDYDNLKECASHLMLRRTKESVGLAKKLPPLHSHLIDVPYNNKAELEFSEDIHSMLQFSSVSLGHRKINGNTARLGKGHVLPLLIHARQSCVLPQLMKKQMEELRANVRSFPVRVWECQFVAKTCTTIRRFKT